MKLAIDRLALAAILWMSACISAAADWREDLGTFRVGIVGSRGLNGVDEAASIQAAYATALGMPVEIFVARDFASLIDAQVTSRVEYAIYSATAFATAWTLCSCVEPLVAPVSADGATGIRSVLITRQDGPAAAEDTVGKRIAMGPPDSAATHQLPLTEFKPGGTSISRDAAGFVTATSDSAALAMLANGEVDAVFGFAPSTADGPLPGGTMQLLAQAGLGDARIIWTSRLLRHGPHAVRTDLPAEAKTILRDTLVGLAAAQPKIYDLLERRRGGGFVPVSPDDYRSALDLVAGILSRETR